MKWWGAWVPAIVFALLASVFTYGSVEWGPPLDRGTTRSTNGAWIVGGFLWLLTTTFLTIAVVSTIRRARNQRN